jgi:hypothetical protein
MLRLLHERHQNDSSGRKEDVVIPIHKSLKPTRHCQKAAATATGALRHLARNYKDRNIFLMLRYTQV